MTSKSEDDTARAIEHLCQDETVRRANSALPQFYLDDKLPVEMTKLLARLDRRF